MDIGVLTFDKFHGRKGTGSTKIRGQWLIKYWEEAEEFKNGGKYDVIIYQKAYWPEHAKLFQGIKILDICDPDWFHWAYRFIEMVQEVDVITTSTESLAIAIRQFTDKKVICIPDRIDLEEFSQKRVHHGRAETAIWFGYSHNFDAIKPVVQFLKKYDLGLTVISNGLFNVPSVYRDAIRLRNLPWNDITVNGDIISGDIVINPKGKNGKWNFKSNNKTLISWALGMPVAHTVEDLVSFLDEKKRIEESKKRIEEIKEKWDIRLSVQEYKELINEVVALKK